MVGECKSATPAARQPGLPRKTMDRTWAGPGSGARCDLCHRVIDEDQVEYEVELSEARNRIITLHLECYERWTIARDALGPPADGL